MNPTFASIAIAGPEAVLTAGALCHWPSARDQRHARAWSSRGLWLTVATSRR